MNKRQLKKQQRYVKQFEKITAKHLGTREGYILPNKSEFEKWTQKEQAQLIKDFQTLTNPHKREKTRGRALNSLIDDQTKKLGTFNDHASELRNLKSHIDLRKEMTDYTNKKTNKKIDTKDVGDFKAFKTLPEEGGSETFGYDADEMNDIWMADFRYLEERGYIDVWEWQQLDHDIAEAIRPMMHETSNGGYYTNDKEGVISVIREMRSDRAWFNEMNSRMVSNKGQYSIPGTLTPTNAENQVSGLLRMGWSTDEVVEALRGDGLSEAEAWRAVAKAQAKRPHPRTRDDW